MAQQANGDEGQAKRAATLKRRRNRRFWRGLARAYAGALLFSVSLYMTMEMWALGETMSRSRLAIFTLVVVAVMVGLAYFRGIDDRLVIKEAVIDAFLGYGVGVIMGAVFLALVGEIEPGMSAGAIVGKVALQATAGGVGALLARGQLGQNESKPEEALPPGLRYPSELFIMLAGALFVGFTIAPTEEVILIAYQMSAWHSLAALALSLAVLHAFVYELEFRGQKRRQRGRTPASVFMRFTVAGYALVFVASLYVLWTFGRLEGTDPTATLSYAVVLGVPGALGAAVARLIL